MGSGWGSSKCLEHKMLFGMAFRRLGKILEIVVVF